MNRKTFTLSEPVTFKNVTYKEVTMKSFKGRALAEFVTRRDEIAEGGNANAPFIMCSISSGEPREVFEEMEMEDLADILTFMKPHFSKLQSAMGNVTKVKKPPTSSN